MFVSSFVYGLVCFALIFRVKWVSATDHPDLLKSFNVLNAENLSLKKEIFRLKTDDRVWKAAERKENNALELRICAEREDRKLMKTRLDALQKQLDAANREIYRWRVD